MNKQQEREKEYLRNVYKTILQDENPFVLRIGKDREMFVIGNGEDSCVTKLDTNSRYRELYATVLDLRDKVIYSLENAIEYAYTEEVQK